MDALALRLAVAVAVVLRLAGRRRCGLLFLLDVVLAGGDLVALALALQLAAVQVELDAGVEALVLARLELLAAILELLELLVRRAAAQDLLEDLRVLDVQRDVLLRLERLAIVVGGQQVVEVLQYVRDRLQMRLALNV